MIFDHEKLDVYQVSLQFVAWSYNLCKRLSSQGCHPRNQLPRASQSVLQNIADGNGKRSGPDRCKFFEIARGSATECAATLDIFAVCNVVELPEVEVAKRMLHRIVSMLTKMTMQIAEENGEYVVGGDGDEHEYEDEKGERR